MIFNLSEVIFHTPGVCQNRNVAIVYKTKDGGSAKEVVCLNGFNLMSFFLALFNRLFQKGAPFVSADLQAALSLYKAEFGSQLTAVTADSSIFEHSVFFKHGQVAG